MEPRCFACSSWQMELKLSFVGTAAVVKTSCYWWWGEVSGGEFMITSQMEKHVLWKEHKIWRKSIHEDLNVFHSFTDWRSAWYQDALWEQCKLLEGVWAMTPVWMLIWNSIPPSALVQTMDVCPVTLNTFIKEIKQSGNMTWANEGMIINYEQTLLS